VLLDLFAPPLCWSCRAPATRGSALCRGCRRSLRFLAPPPGTASGAPWAAVAYEGAARDLVKALKFHGAAGVADEIAALMVAGAPPGLLAGCVVPVPLHPSRMRARGFNQAAVIARALAERAGLRLADVLSRAGPDLRQVGRTRSARLRGPSGSIHATGPVPAAAVLVDDVVTTGATLAACAAELRALGCSHVAALAFARTLGR